MSDFTLDATCVVGSVGHGSAATRVTHGGCCQTQVDKCSLLVSSAQIGNAPTHVCRQMPWLIGGLMDPHGIMVPCLKDLNGHLGTFIQRGTQTSQFLHLSVELGHGCHGLMSTGLSPHVTGGRAALLGWATAQGLAISRVPASFESSRQHRRFDVKV